MNLTERVKLWHRTQLAFNNRIVHRDKVLYILAYTESSIKRCSFKCLYLQIRYAKHHRLQYHNTNKIYLIDVSALSTCLTSTSETMSAKVLKNVHNCNNHYFFIDALKQHPRFSTINSSTCQQCR